MSRKDKSTPHDAAVNKSIDSAAAAAPLAPNPSLNRAARTGEKTEDELLLERPKLKEPRARVPEQAEFTLAASTSYSARRA